jgi:hypothetical protein
MDGVKGVIGEEIKPLNAQDANPLQAQGINGPQPRDQKTVGLKIQAFLYDRLTQTG